MICFRNIYEAERFLKNNRFLTLSNVAGKCVTVQVNAYLLAKDCIPGETHQLWLYRSATGELVNVWCRYCATHVTDPDLRTPGERQVMMAQECSVNSSPDAQLFKTWDFISI